MKTTQNCNCRFNPKLGYKNARFNEYYSKHCNGIFGYCRPGDIYKKPIQALCNGQHPKTPSWEKSPPAPPAFQMEGADSRRGGGGEPVVLVNSSTLPPVLMSFNISTRHPNHLCQLERYHQKPWDFSRAIDFWGQNWEISEHRFVHLF